MHQSELGSVMSPTQQSDLEKQLLETVTIERGHYLYQSGHHGDLWLELNELFEHKQECLEWAQTIAQEMTVTEPDFVCGPETGGALLSDLVAKALKIRSVHTWLQTEGDGSASYRVPPSDHEGLENSRFLIVDDAINAGFAVRASIEELIRHNARPVGVAALLTLGSAAREMAEDLRVPLFTIGTLERRMWPANGCELCALKIPLQRKS